MVNQDGFANPSATVPLPSFSLSALDPLVVQADSLTGIISLSWRPFRNGRFEGYAIWREIIGGVPAQLDLLTAAEDTVWIDPSAAPATDYLYWMELLAAGQRRPSEKIGAVYQLPSITLEEALFSSETATAQLRWSPYTGPGFAAYIIQRQAPGLETEAVAEIADSTVVAHVDTRLNGNTLYTYQIQVQTRWPTAVTSNPVSGRFYPLTEVITLPLDDPPHAIALGLDANDGLYAAQTVVSAQATRQLGSLTLRGQMQVVLPGGDLITVELDGSPDSRSPIFILVQEGRLYAAVGSEGRTWIIALELDGSQVWHQEVPLELGLFPAGLYKNLQGDIFLVDDRNGTYRLHADTGERGETLALNFNTVTRASALTRLHLQRLDGEEYFLLLRPDHLDNRAFSRLRNPPDGLYSLLSPFVALDEGIGFGPGQLLSPVALGYDASRQRLLVMEQQSGLKLFNARPQAQRRYITQLGGFGSGDGQFQVLTSVGAAVAGDSQGRIYVADSTGRVQIFSP
ncbi:MAG: hypothetical protein GKR89_27170 [Candidatus Latescibacteria bacterium]|nr:hypothetical protein [Candidatus Latescibacterota bacterium]